MKFFLKGMIGQSNQTKYFAAYLVQVHLSISFSLRIKTSKDGAVLPQDLDAIWIVIRVIKHLLKIHSLSLIC